MHTVKCNATQIAKTQGEIKICTHSFAYMTLFFYYFEVEYNTK